MLLTISTKHQLATDLSYLLHKRPDRIQSFDLSFGRAHVFYPEYIEGSCSACLLLDVDPVGMARSRRGDQNQLLAQYVNDRSYVASSFLSVAISQVFGSAFAGRCDLRPDLPKVPLPIEARIDVLPVRGGEQFLRRMFEPLGYEVEATRAELDDRFPEWGEGQYFSVAIRKLTTLRELLLHLYVLIPVFDNQKHYFVGRDELEKLLSKGEGWLSTHPEKDEITRRYLRFQSGLVRSALARLVDEESEAEVEKPESDDAESDLERPISLHEQRIGAVLAVFRSCHARRAIDLGCGEGRLIREMLKDRQFERIVAVDVSSRAIERAAQRIGYDRLPSLQKERIELLHGSLMYRDKRFEGFDAASVVEVIEHLDPPRLKAFERVLFEFARPRTVVLTTPNREYNVMWESLPAGKLRHADHRFEWTREEFGDWARKIAAKHRYQVRFLGIGAEDARVGSPTQMAIFERAPDSDTV